MRRRSAAIGAVILQCNIAEGWLGCRIAPLSRRPAALGAGLASPRVSCMVRAASARQRAGAKPLGPTTLLDDIPAPAKSRACLTHRPPDSGVRPHGASENPHSKGHAMSITAERKTALIKEYAHQGRRHRLARGPGRDPDRAHHQPDRPLQDPRARTTIPAAACSRWSRSAARCSTTSRSRTRPATRR